MSSLASQTTLDYGEYGSHNSKTGKRKQRPRIPKIKSSGEGGPLATARSNHDSPSKKASAPPTSPTFVPDYLLKTSGTALPSAHAIPPIEKSSKTKAKIKPLLRKFSSHEQMNIDLSRSAAENESLAIYEQSKTPIRTPSGSVKRGFHNRTTSGTSQMSATTTSSHHYGQPYIHPMRQTPSNTPPIAGSYKNSLDNPEEHQTPYAPLPSKRRTPGPPPLHIRTGSSFTNSSQTNLPGTPSSLRYPTEFDMISPATQRSSLESAFRKNRSRSNTNQTDPAQQAASVQHLRQKFQEKEAAKDRKYAEQEARAAEKEQRKRERKETKQRSRAASEKSSLVGVSYASQSRDALASQKPPVELISPPTLHARRDIEKGPGAGNKVHSQWTLFWMRVRTMWLKLRRKMGGKNKKTAESG